MAVLTAYSGLDGKNPAAFLLEIAERRILLDLGEGPEPGVRPDLAGIGRVDAVFLSHGHIDHVGAIDLWPELGCPPVYATAPTFAAIPVLGRSLPAVAQNLLPLQGPARILDLPVTLGRSGHAIGGVWLHAAHDGGVLYMGDFSRESRILPFDPPPPAALVVTDLSYGDRDQPLAEQVAHLAGLARAGSVFPVPVKGRGAELVLRLRQSGLPAMPCPVVWSEMAALAEDDSGAISPETAAEIRDCLAGLRAVRSVAQCDGSEIIVIADPETGPEGTGSLMEDFATSGLGWRFVYTGHVARHSRAEALIALGRGAWAGWNVHPRASDQIWLARQTQARQLVPAFGRLAEAPCLQKALAAQWCNARRVACVADEESERLC